MTLPSFATEDRFEFKLQTLCLAVIAAVATGFALYFLRSVFLPFVLALFFVVGINPILERIQKFRRVPHLVAVAIAFICGLIILILTWFMVSLSIASLTRDADLYRARVEQMLDYAAHFVNSKLPTQQSAEQPQSEPNAEEADTSENDTPTAAEPEASPSTTSSSTTSIKTSTKTIRNYAIASLQKALQSFTASLVELLGSAVMILLFMFFMLTGSSPSQSPRPEIWLAIESQIREYIVMKTFLSAMTGLAVWLTLTFFGVPLALVFGILAFSLNFIPNIGPLLMCVLPLPLIFLHPGLSMSSMIIAAVMMSVIQFVSGSVVEPKMMGDSFKLHPVVIMLTLLMWGVIWGLPGMFLSTPITAAMRIVFDQFYYTRPLAKLLAGRFE